ncbi:MAG: alpha/beta fold hydrolase [Betaproteobacteria bacterium]
MPIRLSLAGALLLVAVAASAQQMPGVTAKDVTVYTFKLHYLEAGQGPPVILLHGLGGDGSRWGPNITPLAKDFHVFALDQIGFGQSDKPLANYHTGMLADFLAGFMKAVNLPKASLVGNSMGASVALYMAVHYPQLVDRIVLADGGGYRSPGPAAPRRAPTAADIHRRQIQNGVTHEETKEFFRVLFHNKDLVTDQMVDAQLPMRLRSAFAISKIQEAGEKGLGSLTEAEVRGVKAPTLIVWGRYDELANPAGADRLERAIPGAKKVMVDDCGHMPQLEKPEVFNRLVRDFLK